jgi:proteasome maturation protein
MGMLRNVYGSALPARMQLDKQILSRCMTMLSFHPAELDPAVLQAMRSLTAAPWAVFRVGRLPGLPSSQLGLQSMTGELDDFGFESYLGLPEHSENPGADLHSVMEAQLKAGTQPVTRAIL